MTPPENVKVWPTFGTLADLIVLALYTGARIEELCSLRTDDVDLSVSPRHAVLHIRKAKTAAGVRPVVVTQGAPLSVLTRRIKARGQLFHELSPGGADEKLSWAVSKAFGRYRTKCGVSKATDFHSFRRTVITELERAGVDQTSIARFVGHHVGTMAADTYSFGSSRQKALETSKKLRYPSPIDDLAKRLVRISP